MTIRVTEGIPIPVPQAATPTAVVRANDLAFHFAPTQFPYYPQDEDNWCWAACFQMIRQVIGVLPNLSQFQLATQVFGAKACPSASCPSCNQGSKPDVAAHPCGLDCAPRGAIDLTTLQQALQISPAIALINFQTSTGPADHLILIADADANGTLTIYDPFRQVGKSTPSFATFASGYQISAQGFSGTGHWYGTYIYFRKWP